MFINRPKTRKLDSIFPRSTLLMLREVCESARVANDPRDPDEEDYEQIASDITAMINSQEYDRTTTIFETSFLWIVRTLADLAERANRAIMEGTL